MMCHFQNVAVSGQHEPVGSYVLPSDDGTNNANCFSFHVMPISAVLSHLNSLDVSKSAGSDGLPAQFLKAISNKIAEPPLTRLYNDSLHTSIIPSYWKNPT